MGGQPISKLILRPTQNNWEYDPIIPASKWSSTAFALDQSSSFSIVAINGIKSLRFWWTGNVGSTDFIGKAFGWWLLRDRDINVWVILNQILQILMLLGLMWLGMNEYHRWECRLAIQNILQSMSMILTLKTGRRGKGKLLTDEEVRNANKIAGKPLLGTSTERPNGDGRTILNSDLLRTRINSMDWI